MTVTSAALTAFTAEALTRVREQSPVVQCLTNSVVTNFTANALLAAGAAPAMVDIPGEAGPFAGVASGVLINVGSLPAGQSNAMMQAALSAVAAGTPWVLDPVAIGSLPVRTALAHQLAGLQPTVIRGNASEIVALADGGPTTRLTEHTEDAYGAACALATRYGGVVALSGPVDVVVHPAGSVRVANGVLLLTRVTGGGCALGAMMAALAVVEPATVAERANIAVG
jgi:hydroxyethylthiazole kinase